MTLPALPSLSLLNEPASFINPKIEFPKSMEAASKMHHNSVLPKRVVPVHRKKKHHHSDEELGMSRDRPHRDMIMLENAATADRGTFSSFFH